MKRFLLAACVVLIASTGAFFLTGCEDEPAGNTNTNADPLADVTLKPPPADGGFQIVMDAFDVPDGTEKQRTLYYKLPNTADAYVIWIEFMYNEGGRGVKLFMSETESMPDGAVDSFEPLDMGKWRLIGASQDGDFLWRMDSKEGVIMKPGQQLAIQTHFVNTDIHPTPRDRGKVVINFYTVDKSRVTSTLGAIYSNNSGITIPPKTRATFCKVLPQTRTNVNTLLVSSKFHSRGTSLVMGHWDGTKLTDTLHHNTSWLTPKQERYVCGFEIRPTDTLAYLTTFENPTDQPISFGPRFMTEEQSEFILFYMPGPADLKTDYDFSPGFMVKSEELK